MDIAFHVDRVTGLNMGVTQTTETLQTMPQVANTRDAGSGCPVLERSSSQDPVSYWVEDFVDTLTNGVTLAILLLISVPANVINAIVFYRHGLRERINLCVFALSLVDLLYVLQSFCLFSDRIYTYVSGEPRVGAVIWFFTTYDLTGFLYLNTVSWFISALIASERCFCVVSPLKSKTVLKTKSSAAILLLSSAVILAGGYVSELRWGVACVFDTATNSTTFVLSASEFYQQHPQLLDFLEGIVYGIAIPGFCFTVVIATTVITVVRLKSIATWREKSTTVTAAQATKDNALTRMLVGTSVLFLVLAVPMVGLRLAMLVVPGLNVGGTYHNLFLVVLNLSIMCGYINCSVNFFVYYSLGTKFRRSVHDLFKRNSKHNDGNTQMNTTQMTELSNGL